MPSATARYGTISTAAVKSRDATRRRRRVRETKKKIRSLFLCPWQISEYRLHFAQKCDKCKKRRQAKKSCFMVRATPFHDIFSTILCACPHGYTKGYCAPSSVETSWPQIIGAKFPRPSQSRHRLHLAAMNHRRHLRNPNLFCAF